MATPLSTLVTDFLEYCEIERGLSQRTIRNYDHYLNRFVDWEKIAKPELITADRIRQYRLKLNRFENNKGEPLKKQTQAYHLIAVRAFLKYLAKRDIKTMAAEKIELPKTSGRQIEFLTVDEVEKLLKQPNAKDMAGLRDRAIFELLFSTGLRISELTSLDIDQVNLKNDSFSVRGKGDKVRVVFLSERARDSLKKYLHERRDDSPALFIRHDRGANKAKPEELRITPRTVQRMVQHYARLAGINKEVTPHTIRHSFATDLLNNGADIRSVQAMLGHASITTTQVYTHVTDRQLENVHKHFHGKNLKKDK